MSLPEAYERFLVEPLFRPFAEELLDRLNPGQHDSLLDVACGTGDARIARRRLGPGAGEFEPAQIRTAEPRLCHSSAI